jgi:P-type Cu+ transporter
MTEHKDPVCGMTVDPARAAGQSTYHGQTFYFCNPHCKTKFDADPAKYVSSTRPLVHSSTGFTCPMHPEVISDKPGTCPICGMALEPRVATLEQQPNDELRDMQRRFAISAILTAPLLVLGMAMRGPLWLQAVLATPVVVWGGAPFFARGWRSVVTRRLNMFTLIALGTGVAFVWSVAALALRRHDLYFEPAAVITTLVLLGQVLELRARERTSGAIRSLLGLAPKSARVVSENGDERDVDVAHIHPSMRLRIRPGERVAVDGVIVDGTCAVDESMLTGEPLPVEKAAGDKLTSGTVLTTGSVILRAERVGADTLLAQIVRMVADAQRSRAPIQRLADVVAAWFVPAVIAVAVITFVVWLALGSFNSALVNAIAVLIIACPCALGLATPMSVMVATGKGATAGILIRNAEALETLAKVDTLVVDKTGTLTEGRPKLTEVHVSDDVLRLVATLERASEHPLADAIVRGAQERGLALGKASDHASNVETLAGRGIRGVVDGHRVAVGNARLFAGLPLPEASGAMHVVVDDTHAGTIGVSDPIKESTPGALAALRAKGIAVTMLTGDARATAEQVAKTLGIPSVEAEVLPAEKEAVIRRLQSAGHRVAMAGDGVNDAPALSRAEVGIAMGSGTDIAIESAGITLVRGDLRGIARARTLSEAMMRNIKQNLFFAFVYNLLGIPIAALGILNPMIASAAMTFSSVTVIANALRLRRARL